MKFSEEKKSRNWKKIILVIVAAVIAYILIADFTPSVQHVEKVVQTAGNSSN